MIRRGVSDPTPKVPPQIIGAKSKETKVTNLITIIMWVNMSGMGTTIAINTTPKTTMEAEMIGLGLIFLHIIWNLAIGKFGAICYVSRI